MRVKHNFGAISQCNKFSRKLFATLTNDCSNKRQFMLQIEYYLYIWTNFSTWPRTIPIFFGAVLPCELFSQMENKTHMGLSKSSLDIEAQKFMTYGSEADSSWTVVCEAGSQCQWWRIFTGPLTLLLPVSLWRTTTTLLSTLLCHS